MALNTNIALGAQPVQQQPNMLAQYAQVMGIKAAQQEMEGYEGVKNAITGGMDANDPRMLQYGKRGIEAFRAAGEGRVKQQDALTKAYVNQRKSLDFVSTPDDLLAHGLSQFNDPVIAPQLKAQGLTPEKLTASFQKQLATEGFESLLKKRAMGLDDWYKDQTSRANAATAAGPGYQRNQLERERFNLEKADSAEIARILQGATPTAPAAVTPPMTGGGGGVTPATSVSPAPMGAGPAPVAATTPASVPSAAGQPNVLATQVAPPPAQNVNALSPDAQASDKIVQDISALIRTGKPKAIQAAEALIKEYNVRNPAGKIERDANGSLVLINERTGSSKVVTGADGKPLASGVAPVWNEKAQVYMTPPTPENPAGKVTEIPELRQIAKKRSATETLDIAGFNKTTGTNEISDLIKQSTSGLAENALAKTAGALFGKGTSGAEAIATLETRANELTLGLAPNGSLGAGFSNDDRTFMLAKLGDVANANKPMNVRLAAWEDVMKRAARNAGVDYKGTGGGGASGGNTGGAKTVIKTGTFNNRKVVQYSDGSTAYAD